MSSGCVCRIIIIVRFLEDESGSVAAGIHLLLYSAIYVLHKEYRRKYCLECYVCIAPIRYIHPDDNYFDYYRTSFPCLQIDFPKEREKRETRRKRIIIIIAHWYIVRGIITVLFEVALKEKKKNWRP